MIKALFTNKIYFLLVILIILFGLIFYIITNNKHNVNIYLTHNESINKLLILDDELNNFLKSRSEFIIFDTINFKIDQFQSIINKLQKEVREYDLPKSYANLYAQLDKEFNEKVFWIERFKARKSFEFNIITFILDRKNVKLSNLSDVEMKKINNIRFDLMERLELKIHGNVNLFEKYDLDLSKKYIKNFMSQVKALENSISFQNKYINTALNPKIESILYQLKEILENKRLYTQKIVFGALNILFLITMIFLIILIFIYRKFSHTKDQLSAFRKAVEISDNVIVMTDKESNITYANDAFEKVSGYKKELALGQKPNILKSGLQDDNFYKNLNETISNGQTWRGQFINKSKEGELFYENASISPIYSNGEIEGYLAIKLDVTESVKQAEELDKLNKSLEQKVNENIKELREKDKTLFEQSKMAAMGEMIGNIAHQWRQPLSIISSSATGMSLQNELALLDSNDIAKNCDLINKNAQYLSNTIDDFRNFIKGERIRKEFNLCELMQSFIKLIEGSVKNSGIDVIFAPQKNIVIDGYQNELTQCFMNIFNNAKDAMTKNDVIPKYVFINCSEDEEFIYIAIKDNGGGIPEEVLPKIFEPYFTTKHQSQGTGLGLHMSYNLITQGMNGTIEAHNVHYQYEGNEYYGAEFIIKLPIERNLV